MQVVRTPEERFADVVGYPFKEHWHAWREPGGTTLRMHYVDEGRGPVVLLLHGQPMWSWLYRDFVPPLVEAGYRCVVPDYVGFGKSDKITLDSWYVIERHVESVRSLIDGLELDDITIVVHDWGGPIGLRQVVDTPARFRRLVILNTWLHHVEMEYTPAVRAYHARMAELPAGTGDIFGAMPIRQLPALGPSVAAPFPGPEHMAGARRFPLLHPYADPRGGNAADQARCFEALRSWPKPAHVIFSHADPVFPATWGRRWSQLFPFGTFDVVETQQPHHFLQLSRAGEIVERLLAYTRS